MNRRNEKLHKEVLLCARVYLGQNLICLALI